MDSSINIKLPSCEMRKLYVDYSDKTPNEPRNITANTNDDIVFYPLGNIYYDKYNGKLIELPSMYGNDMTVYDKEKFLTQLEHQRISYAIKFLQINALKKYISKNYKNTIYENPFSDLFSSYYPIEYNLHAAKKIITILIENYDDHYYLITSLHYQSNKNKYLLELLYSFLPIDENNACYICLYTEPKAFLINPCVCKTPVHCDCLIKTIVHQKNQICVICNNKYRCDDPIYRTMSGIMVKSTLNPSIYFPYDDLYYAPLISNPLLTKYTGMSRLTMAIMYLQVNRVKELLNDNDITSNLDTYYFGYDGYKQNPITALCNGNLPSNCHISFGDNMTKYMRIIKMLLDTKKINLDEKDVFDKTYKDYIEHNNLQILHYLFTM